MEIKLIWEEISKDADGFPLKTEHIVEVPCKEKSVTRTEKYESMRAGVSVEKVFEVRREDWELTRHLENDKPEYARKAEYDGWVYTVQRTYSTNKSKIEVMCG